MRQTAKNPFLSIAVILFCLLGLACSPSVEKTFTVEFDSTKKVAGRKIAIKDINPGLPTDWREYNFVLLEMMSTTSQRFKLVLPLKKVTMKYG
ncbi:MAG: hypothetical protein RIM83_01450 [Allomuricauda sp.]